MVTECSENELHWRDGGTALRLRQQWYVTQYQSGREPLFIAVRHFDDTITFVTVWLPPDGYEPPPRVFEGEY